MQYNERFRQILRLDEDPILVEQLRLIYKNMTGSMLPMFPVIVLLVYTLNDGRNLGQLLLWSTGLCANNIFLMLEARQRLRDGFRPERAVALVGRMMLSIGIGGVAWGLLAWGTLGSTTLAGNVLVIGLMAGVLAGAVALLSPIPPVFVALVVPLCTTTVLRLWQLDDPAFKAFSAISAIYVGALIMQSRNGYQTVRAAVGLRFENLELVQRAESARQEAERASTAKSRFLAAASHDLRQPIHAQGLLMAVFQHTPMTAQQRDLLGSIQDTRETTAEMLNVLLDFSRIEAGVIKPQVQPFRMQPLLNRLEREFGAQADAKGLIFRARETPVIVLSDAALVESVLRNFISNAIRYTEHGGLLVTCRRRANLALLEVRDTGIGIAPEQQKEVFRDFHQLANPERDNRKGLGLGLAIADGLARTLGHRLTLKSRPGKGSAFALELPLFEGLLPKSADTVVRPPHQLWLPGLRVLLIDDEPAIRTSMAHLLGSWGCEHAAAESIEQALELVVDFAPEVLVSDYRLRDRRTGAQAIVALRERLGRTLPCVIITGDTAPERLREAMASGVPLLHKPVAPQQLYQALAAVRTSRENSVFQQAA